MDALMPTDPMFDPEPVTMATLNEWYEASEELRTAEDVFVASMRQVIALRSGGR
jgi:hypothetical protein